MSKTSEALRSIKIYNDWELTATGHPMIHYRGAQRAIPNDLLLSIKGKAFKDAPWYNNGAKSFCDHRERTENLKDALAWIEQNFPSMKMVRSPFGGFSYIPEEDLNKALAKLPKKVNENKLTKVFGGNDILEGIQYRMIVAAKSRAEAARLTGVSKSYIKNYWATTENEAEVKLANSKPGTVFIKPLNDYNGAWAELAK